MVAVTTWIGVKKTVVRSTTICWMCHCPERVVCVFYVLQTRKCTDTIHSEMP
jgi:hypothetical protein